MPDDPVLSTVLSPTLVMALGAAPSPVAAATWTIFATGCDSTTIQGAITLAPAGDEIVLLTGSPFTEGDVVVDESAEIRGFPGLPVTV